MELSWVLETGTPRDNRDMTRTRALNRSVQIDHVEVERQAPLSRSGLVLAIRVPQMKLPQVPEDAHLEVPCSLYGAAREPLQAVAARSTDRHTIVVVRLRSFVVPIPVVIPVPRIAPFSAENRRAQNKWLDQLLHQ